MTTDSELLTGALRGEDRQLNALFSRYRPQVYALALGICGPTPLAEDAVQDAFLMAYHKLGQLKDPSAFLPWLKQIVANCCYQALLPESLRSTVALRYLSDYASYQQIAEILGVPVGTVRSRLSEGRKLLARQWNAHQYADEAEYNNSGYWSAFYSEVLLGVYEKESYLPLLLQHTHPTVAVTFTSGRTIQGTQGNRLLEQSYYDDFAHGSRMQAIECCISSGNMSLMRITFANSAEFPHHCPPHGYYILYRQMGKLVKMHMHHAQREKQSQAYEAAVLSDAEYRGIV